MHRHFDNLNVPPGWRVETLGCDGIKWVNKKRNLQIIASTNLEQDGREWLHLSISHPDRLPTYKDMTYMKRHWAGDDKKCIQVFPARTEHVNFHPNCLHLFCCLDGDALPDFTWGTGMV